MAILVKTGLAISRLREMPGMNGCIAIVATLTCAGCATEPVAVHLPARSFAADIALTARALGKLKVRDGCIRIGDALVIWPAGSHLVTDEDRQLVVTQDGRRYVVGSHVALGGGGSVDTPKRLAAPLPPACAGPFFSAH